ncbi:hypothetical protein EXIGLDRAFT_728186 [Exidia glandulosa HHB12029]|uniref:Uncharacterized protein n=1 Tax=Exidia glandulosa HHB12029 TaxID=1314781 RepID=A0A165D199_EXIGL|nr:hypothetical protein EXIGLDRAFT_728186 [Exidia glandulosa HHB12029]
MTARPREDWLYQAMLPTPPTAVKGMPTNNLREKTGYSITRRYYVDASYVPRITADPWLMDLHRQLNDFGDRSWAPDDASLALYGCEGVDCTLWFKDTRPQKPATVFLVVDTGARYLNARLHIRPSTIVHATLKVDDKHLWRLGTMVDVKARLPADFTGMLVVTVPNDGSQRIDLASAFRQRTRVINSVVIPAAPPEIRPQRPAGTVISLLESSPRDPPSEMISHTLFVGEGYDESTPWKGTTITVEGRSARAAFLPI